MSYCCVCTGEEKMRMLIRVDKASGSQAMALSEGVKMMMSKIFEFCFFAANKRLLDPLDCSLI